MLAPAWTACGAAADTHAVVRFNQDVRPVLSDACFSCHGPDPAHRKAGLRLDRREALFEARENGHVVVPGKPDVSLLYRRLTASDPEEFMPPPKAHKALSAEQKNLIARWIEQGAPWEPHWSWVAPVRPQPPAVKDAQWVRNPIDAFVLARLESEGLTPNPQSDRRSLIRRLSLDLIGLPPTPAEVEAFVADPSENAYEKVVDRLLASPRYGEHRARYWLDAARYGDTHGVHNDNYVSLWPFRDWVIGAFNRDLPFDQFTVEQIAGDLLPNHTTEQWIATGFHRCNPTTSEGGSITAEVEADYAKDRVETTCTVWLGVTGQCSVCHDHKFDPITMRDFYSMSAFFRNTSQRAMDGNVDDTPPNLPVPKDQDRPRWRQLQRENAAIKAAMEREKAAAGKAFDLWISSAARTGLTDPLDVSWQDLAVALDEPQRKQVAARVGGEVKLLGLPAGVNWDVGPAGGDTAIHFGAKASLAIEGAGDLDADQPFSLGGWVFIPAREGQYRIAGKIDADVKEAPGWLLDVSDRLVGFRMAGDRGAKDGLLFKLDLSDKVKGGAWAHVFVTYDGSRHGDGLQLYIDGKPQNRVDVGNAELKGAIHNKAAMELGGGGNIDLQGGAICDFRIYRRELTAEEVTVVSHWPGSRRRLHDDASKLSGAERDNLKTLYLNRFDSIYGQSARGLEKNLDAQRRIRRSSPIALVMDEEPNSQGTAHVLDRGRYDQPREEVRPDVIASLGGLHPDWPRNRLGLARWLIDRENPLTPRVTANRMWSELFGQGIVRTSEDFGIMGEAPSHPQLLDWLAVEFRDGDNAHGAAAWDTKHLFKLMVMSATYQQSPRATPEKLARDPENRLFSRGPRFRMDAEVLRDYALAASGLLADRIGGPSVKPYQPPGVWEAVAMLSSNTRFYEQDSGENLYRRSLYTFIKRSAPPASMNIFNAPSRLECVVRRERTDTPLQALVTMNDPQWVEASRHLAERAIRESGDDFDERLDFVTLAALSRPLEPRERDVCRHSLGEFRKAYDADSAAAEALIHAGDSKPAGDIPANELAAWTMLASEVMNTDEALNK